jgi:hypothetical protein
MSRALRMTANYDGELLGPTVAARLVRVSVQLEHVLKAALVADPLADFLETELVNDRE